MSAAALLSGSMMDSERQHLETFVDILGEFDLSTCEFGDAPDLCVQGAHSLIGVEHTRLYRVDSTLPSGRQLRPQERIHHQIAARAHETFRNRNPVALYLTVTFSEPSDYRTRDVSRVGDELAAAVLQSLTFLGARALPELTFNVEAWEFQRRRAPFPQGIASFMLKIVDDPYELWGPSYGYMVPRLSVGDIAATIDAKESRIQQYRSRCDLVWLLMVTDIGMPSSHYSVPRDVIEHRYATRFERLFLLTLSHRSLFELSVESAPPRETAPNEVHRSPRSVDSLLLLGPSRGPGEPDRSAWLRNSYNYDSSNHRQVTLELLHRSRTRP